MQQVFDNHLTRGERIVYRAWYHWIFNIRSLFILNTFHAIAVTNKRVLERSGVLNILVQSIPLSQIESVDIAQTLPGRVFGYGDVIVQGSGSTVLRLEQVADPIRLMSAIAGSGVAIQTGGAATRTGAPAPREQAPGKPVGTDGPR